MVYMADASFCFDSEWIFAKFADVMKNLITRAMTGAIYVGLIIAGILLGNVAFLALSCLLAGLALNEFCQLTKSGTHAGIATSLTDLAGGLILVTGVNQFVWALGKGYSFPLLTFWGGLYLIYFIARLVMQLYRRDERPLASLAVSMMGQMYIALPISLMSLIYYSEGGKALTLGMFVMIWLNDTGAYLVGSRIGRRRLFERISPKKSWEGFFGGVVFAVGAGFLYRYGFADYFDHRSWAVMAGYGLVVAVFATWGDLVESLLKRTLGVKDSGNLLPGHGGILDRIDSLLMVIPATVVYLCCLRLF